MSIEYYLGDWFYNIGIVGLLRILRFNNVGEDKYTVDDNCLKLDEQILDNFAEYYFNYFFSVYDNTENLVGLIDNTTDKIDKSETDEIGKAIKDVVAGFKKYENTVKNTSFTDEYGSLYSDINAISKSIKSNNSEVMLNQASATLKDIKAFITREAIRKKRAANISRSALSEFFGQASFLNPSFKGAYAEDFVQKMNDDYVEPVKLKYSEKAPALKVTYNCSICSRATNGKTHFDEAMFAPLGLSLTQNSNYLWNRVTIMPICEECRLLLMCTPAGCTPITKTRIVNDELQYYREYNFVNLDTDINGLFTINENFRQRSDYSNPYKELILDIVTKTEQKARWTLQSIFFIEFHVENKSTTLHYFSIPPYKASFLVNKQTHYLLEHIRPRRFQMDVLEDILADKDIIISATQELRYYMQKKEGRIKVDVGDTVSCFNAIQLRYLLKGFRKGWSKVNTRIINEAFEYGKELNRYYISNDAANKVNSIGYKMLNAVKVGDKDEFMDNLLRTCMSIQKPIPELFLNVLSEQKADFEDIALAFISGFIAAPAVMSTEENNNNQEVK